jgi:hypothetical protein
MGAWSIVMALHFLVLFGSAINSTVWHNSCNGFASHDYVPSMFAYALLVFRIVEKYFLVRFPENRVLTRLNT